MKTGAEEAGAEFQDRIDHQCTLGLGESTPLQDTDNKQCKKALSGEDVGETFGTSP